MDPGSRSVPSSFQRFPPRPPSLEEALTRVHPPRPNQRFQPLPQPSGPYPYRLRLDEILHKRSVRAIEDAGRIVFHCVGDTGGLKDPHPQEAVAEEMERDLDRPDPPAFFYHLGDVVYDHGAEDSYYAQFYEPYAHYYAPIFAIPGNHDGLPNPVHPMPSLSGFVRNFCATAPRLTAEAHDVTRAAMTQPNVYWTLEAPFVTVIGIYTNIPGGGQIADDQIRWLVNELEEAAEERALIVAMHHPIYSGDGFHGSNLLLGDLFDAAFEEAGRWPDAVFAGHSHNYQRFTRVVDGRAMPYVVAGAGGYRSLERMAKPAGGGELTLPWRTPVAGVTLDAYDDRAYGYMRVTASGSALEAEYVSVPKPGRGSGPSVTDRWTLDIRAHALSAD